MKVKNLLEESSRSFVTIRDDQSVDIAVNLMSANRLSALIVMLENQPCGIFTEHDLLRCHIMFASEPTADIPVRDVMSEKLIVAEPCDTIDDAMGMMIKAKIRHLPVVSKGQIRGMLCLEDLVKTHVGALTQELHYLKDYISDLQDAAHD